MLDFPLLKWPPNTTRSWLAVSFAAPSASCRLTASARMWPASLASLCSTARLAPEAGSSRGAMPVTCFAIGHGLLERRGHVARYGRAGLAISFRRRSLLGLVPLVELDELLDGRGPAR